VRVGVALIKGVSAVWVPVGVDEGVKLDDEVRVFVGEAEGVALTVGVGEFVGVAEGAGVNGRVGVGETVTV
jgi:predicted methyltransferase MtxX (methanogen marker protein 4)